MPYDDILNALKEFISKIFHLDELDQVIDHDPARDGNIFKIISAKFQHDDSLKMPSPISRGVQPSDADVTAIFDAINKN